MPIRTPPDIAPSEITPRAVYLGRRELLAGSAFRWGSSPPCRRRCRRRQRRRRSRPSRARSPPRARASTRSPTSPTTTTSMSSVPTRPTQSGSRARLAIRPWKVEVGGLVNKPNNFDLDDLLKRARLEERIYRMRCVEGWSMVIPWVGFPLATAEAVEPHRELSTSLFRPCTTLKDAQPERVFPPLMALCRGPAPRRGHAPSGASWRRHLRGDAADQNGAPIRLVVPWKYGFKGIKSIVKITLVETAAHTWNIANARRVRLLFQREPAGGPSALEPGHGAPHRRACSPGAGRRSCSTATATRSRASTRAWT